MNDTRCIAGRHPAGRYLLSPHAGRAWAAWIEAQQYVRYETPERRLRGERGRAKNTLYRLPAPDGAGACVMKVTAVSPRYLWRRRLELYIRQCLSDDARRAFEACRALRAAGAPVAMPLAWWRHGRGPRARGYFLSELAPGAPLGPWCEAAAAAGDAALDVVARKLAAILRALHACGWRHGDPQLRNWLAVLGADGAPRSFCLLDYDHCARARVAAPAVKRFFDLRCLAGLSVPGVAPRDMLAAYDDAPPSRARLAALEFWRAGGFSLRRRLRRRRPRPRGAHLKPGEGRGESSGGGA